jgi:ribosomal peptide maturation radical SAM protein 1
MFKIALIQMPFASLPMPSLALTQLKAVLDRTFGEAVSTRVVYVSHDIGKLLGTKTYQRIAFADSAFGRLGPMTGFGEWFFRQAAFPHAPDNTEEYLDGFFSARTELASLCIDAVRTHRPHVASVLEELIHRYELDDVDLVGMSSMFAQNTACFAMARVLKASRRPPTVVMGGANCEFPMGQVIADNVSAVDAVFSGPGLVSFPRYVEACLAGDAGRAAEIPGVLTSRRAQLANATLGQELDINVPLDLDYGPFLSEIEQITPGAAVLTFETSRGCWWGAKAHCPFCGLNGSTMAHRAMAPEHAIDQFEHLFRYADKVHLFECVDNIMPANYPADVFAHLDGPKRSSIYYEVKADVKDADLHALVRGGVRIIQPGIEALSTPTLKRLKKGTTAFGNVSLLKACLVHGVKPLWNFLIGIPGEDDGSTYERYLHEIPHLVHLPPPWGIMRVRFDRFSPYFDRPAEYGIELRPMGFYNFVYPFSPEDLAGLAYYFEDGRADAAYARAASEWHGPLAAAVERWNQVWITRDRRRPPALFVTEDGDGATIHDSRCGKMVEYPIGPAEFEALKTLERPLRLTELGSAASVIAHLDDRHLLFREGERVMSLVSIGDPSESRGQVNILDTPEYFKCA